MIWILESGEAEKSQFARFDIYNNWSEMLIWN